MFLAEAFIAMNLPDSSTIIMESDESSAKVWYRAASFFAEGID